MAIGPPGSASRKQHELEHFRADIIDDFVGTTDDVGPDRLENLIAGDLGEQPGSPGLDSENTRSP
jgi:hypothetical protein